MNSGLKNNIQVDQFNGDEGLLFKVVNNGYEYSHILSYPITHEDVTFFIKAAEAGFKKRFG